MIKVTILSYSFVILRRGCLAWGEIRGGRKLEEEEAMVRFYTTASKSLKVSTDQSIWVN